ncbi:MAG: GYD domain-containing protein [Trebonia sp.]|jgi:uncharacterized protein with GYD domain
MYLVQFTLTPATWAEMLKKPEDRRAALTPLYTALGGKLHGFWYASSGDGDGYVLGELPDDIAAARAFAMVNASGAFKSLSATKLLSVEEMLQALRGAADLGYTPPGSSST